MISIINFSSNVVIDDWKIFVLSIVGLIVTIIISYIKCKKTNSYVEKTIYILIPFIYFVFAVIYILDRYNIPTSLNWDMNVSVERWFSFITSAAGAIIGAVISGIITIFVMLKQIKVQIDSNNDDKRVQNAPIFKYQIQNIHIQTDLKYIMLSNNEGNPYNLFIYIENLGLNHARNIEFLVTDVASKNSQKFRLDDMQSILKRDDSKWLQIMFNYIFDSKNLSTNNKQITILFSYSDLLNNKYNQELNLYLEVTSESGGQYGGYKLNIVSAEVKNEVQIKEEVK